MRPSEPGPDESEDTRLHTPDVRRQQIRTRFEAPLLQLRPPRPVRDNIFDEPHYHSRWPNHPARPEFALTRPPGICPCMSKGSIRSTSRSCSSSQQKRIAPAALASFISHVFIVVAACAVHSLRPRIRRRRPRSCPSSRTSNIIWLSQPGPGGGGGGGGNKMKEPPRKAELPGKDKITVPVAKPPKIEMRSRRRTSRLRSSS